MDVGEGTVGKGMWGGDCEKRMREGTVGKRMWVGTVRKGCGKGL